MSRGFANPIIGGGGSLVYPSIHSPNFTASPLTGWSIDQTGNLYAGSATIEGTITAATIIGALIESSSGTPSLHLTAGGNIIGFAADGTQVFRLDVGLEALLIYADSGGTGVQGALNGSWASEAGTDGLTGTPFPAGLNIGVNTLPQVLLQPGSPHASLSFPLNAATAFTDPLVKAGALGSPEFADLVLSGPVHPTQQDQVYIELNSSDGTSSANGALAYLTTGNVNELVASWDDTGFAVLQPLRIGAQGLPPTPASGVILWGDTNGNLEKLTPSGRYATLSDGSVSHTSYTVTAATLSVLTDTWIVPPDDAAVNTCYRLRAWGSGTQGSTAQQLNFVFSYNGANNAQAGLGSSSFAANETFEWEAEMIAVVASTGTGGVITHKLSVHASSNSVGSTGAGGYSVIRTGSFAVDTTSQINLSLDFFWGSTTGSPTVTGRGSTFERLGA